MNKTALIALGSALLLAGAATAQVAPNPSPAAVQAGRYAVEPGHTRVLFSVSHLGFSTWYGDFTGASGALILDPKNPAASTLQVSLPIASVATTNATLDGELKSADWLDADKFATASFRSTKVVVTRPGQADVTGALTLHGVTRPLVLHVKFNAAGINALDKHYTAGFEVRGSFRRSDFGVTKYVPLVGDEVQLIISSAFVKPAA